MASQTSEHMQHYEQLAEQGDASAKYRLAQMLQEQNKPNSKTEKGNSKIIKPSSDSVDEVTDKQQKTKLSENPQPNRVFKLYESACIEGLHSQSCTALALLHFSNRSEGSNDKALKYFQIAADLGDPQANNYLGVLYLYGTHVERNVTKAQDNFEIAADFDVSESNFHLGDIILGLHDRLNTTDRHNNSTSQLLALRYYEKAGDLGFPMAIYREAQMYELGKGVEASCQISARSYKAVAEILSGAAGFVDRAFDWRHGTRFFAESNDKLAAVIASILGAQEGYEQAQSNTGWLFSRPGVCRLSKIDPQYCHSSLIRFHSLAVMNGNVIGFGALANSLGVKRTGWEQTMWPALLVPRLFRMAVTYGDFDAIPKLARCYETRSSHLTMDLETAYKHYNFFVLYADTELEHMKPTTLQLAPHLPAKYYRSKLFARLRLLRIWLTKKMCKYWQ
eukprot:GHVL01018454.1.p1 GENE.GHVL01018454.1~~GHVL01018454.1.p1  ORF type:complete len:449 (-),score=71.53 GHVL01018454.1:103-1449(-)